VDNMHTAVDAVYEPSGAATRLIPKASARLSNFAEAASTKSFSNVDSPSHRLDGSIRSEFTRLSEQFAIHKKLHR
jgi:hypothetical protein